MNDSDAAQASAAPSRGGGRLGKKPYSKPQIKDYGSLAELTGTAFGTINDGGGPFAFSGAAG